MKAENSSDRSRNLSMDILRLIACLMVITLHVTADLFYNPWSSDLSVMAVYYCISAGAVPLFFMMSGAFSSGTSISKSLRKILYFFILFVIFKCFYAVWDSFIEQSLSLSTLYYEKRITDLTVHKYHLWYIPEYMMVLLAAPVINSATKQNKKIPAFLSVLFILYTILLPSSSPITLPGGIKTNPVEAILEVIPVNFMLGIGYFCIGKTIYNFIKDKEEFLKKRKIALYAVIALWIIVIILMSYTTITRSISGGAFDDTKILRETWLVFFSSVPLFAFFCILPLYREGKAKEHRIISTIIPCTLYIYLIHPFFAELYRHLGLNSLSFNPTFSVPVLDVLVLIPSLLFAVIALTVHRLLKSLSSANNHISS